MCQGTQKRGVNGELCVAYLVYRCDIVCICCAWSQVGPLPFEGVAAHEPALGHRACCKYWALCVLCAVWMLQAELLCRIFPGRPAGMGGRVIKYVRTARDLIGIGGYCSLRPGPRFMYPAPWALRVAGIWLRVTTTDFGFSLTRDALCAAPAQPPSLEGGADLG
jgi:hypothetical protein